MMLAVPALSVIPALFQYSNMLTQRSLLMLDSSLHQNQRCTQNCTQCCSHIYKLVPRTVGYGSVNSDLRSFTSHCNKALHAYATFTFTAPADTTRRHVYQSMYPH